MRTGSVIGVDWLGEMPDQNAGAEPVLRVTTTRHDDRNAFYMDTVDLDGREIKRPLANQPADAPVDPEAINFGDPITFDKQDGIHKVALWKGRRIRQRGYSFDWLATSSTGQSY